ncbi:T9SS type A sorting domain-containing protein [Chryseobacterium populi]|uniref:Por secretion system C-terminal sorting domain containing protein n=1 Tax=Chryseobacterium populi TaxID=1144316 RepID=J2K2L8_9FLAO|nr:T9SS type A sorting domain-containing protein [Chryseobacterium populi]EJL74400.1 Por secretion system C-terminal sorting domain containing protein [Chryseobacterium populi]
MKILYGTALLLCTMGLSGQEILWQKDLKSSSQALLNQIVPTIDGQYLITGSSIQDKQRNGYDFHVVKLDQQGNQIWENFFAGSGHDYLSAAVATQEGGFLLSGTSNSGKGQDKKNDTNGGSDIWIVRLNEAGDQLWQKTLGTPADDEAKAVIQTTDLGYFIAGTINNADDGFGSKDAWIIRLDKDGNKISETILGGFSLDETEKLIPTMDGGALIGIYSRSSNRRVDSNAPVPSSATFTPKTIENYGEGDYWVVKLDKNGKVEWEKNFGGKGDDHLRTLALTSTGYLIGGESRSERSGNKTTGIEEGTDLWLISLNERGEELWQKSYNFKNRDVLMGMSVLHSSDDKSSKGILLGGYTQAEGRIATDDETFWMLYLNGDGKEEWRKHIKGESSKKLERLSDLKLNKDGSILLAGTSAEKPGKESWKIVKLGDKQINELIEKQDIKLYPNPAHDYSYVEIGFDFKEADILIYDMAGKLLQQIQTKNKVTKLNTQTFIQGAYLISITTDSGKSASIKLIKN